MVPHYVMVLSVCLSACLSVIFRLANPEKKVLHTSNLVEISRIARVKWYPFSGKTVEGSQKLDKFSNQ